MSAMTPGAMQALQLLKQGNATAALEAASHACRADANDAKAHLAAGIALLTLKRIDEAQAAFERAAALDPADFAPLHELGLVHEMKGESDRALEAFERATQLRPTFAAAHFGVGLGRFRRGEWPAAIAAFGKVLAIDAANVEAMVNLANAYRSNGDAARAAEWLERALARHPDHRQALRSYGLLLGARGEFARAGDLLARASQLDPADIDTALSQAHADLVAGNLARGWAAYRYRPTRRQYEGYCASQGIRYRVPALAELEGQEVILVGEQGLGDVLFFLRWARPLAEHTGRISFAGDARLHTILRRTGLFASLAPGEPVPTKGVLVGDLPVVLPRPEYPPTLRVDPEPARLAHWRGRLEALGPRPWIGVTWRAGVPTSVFFRTVPIERFFAGLAPLEGTIVAIQRKPEAGEMLRASASLGRPVHDLSSMNDDLEDALALVALLDRHIGVSNTNTHLAALAGRPADVLEQFPPEWRWQLGESSAWFPGFRLHRQAVSGDWTPALASLLSDAAGSTSRA